MTSSAVRTAARVASEIPGLPFRTRLTVASLTPACLATSASFPATLQLYDKSLQLFADEETCAGHADGCRSGRTREAGRDAQWAGRSCRRLRSFARGPVAQWMEGAGPEVSSPGKTRSVRPDSSASS